MKCNDLMEEYIHIERYERLPFHMAFHLLYCKKCRETVKNMTLATHFTSEKIRSKASKNNPIYMNTMQRIMASQNIVQHKKKPFFSLLILSIWSVIGSSMLAIFLVIPSTKLGIRFMQVFGSYFTLQFLFTVVSFLTICTIIFIARNLNFFVETFKLANPKA
ncbi:MAG: hypothetical protein ACTTKH_01560 [Treponema sp.]